MSSYLFFLKDAIAWRNGHWKFYYDESGIGHEENDSTILGKWIEPVLQDGSSDLPKKWTFEITVVETEQTLKKTLFPLLSMTETRAQFLGQLVRIELLALSNFLKKTCLRRIALQQTSSSLLSIISIKLTLFPHSRYTEYMIFIPILIIYVYFSLYLLITNVVSSVCLFWNYFFCVCLLNSTQFLIISCFFWKTCNYLTKRLASVHPNAISLGFRNACIQTGFNKKRKTSKHYK